MTKHSQIELQQTSIEVRKDIIEMIYEAESGHPGGSLSAVELLVSLYYGGMEQRDKFFLSNGHICPAWYSVLATKGLIERDLLSTYAKLGSPLQGHPEKKWLSLVENTSGPLGLGLAQAAGYAASARLDGKNLRVYCMVSDAEHNEGNTWEAIMFANKYKLSNLTLIVDRNGIQIEGTTEEIMPLGSLASKYQSFGWEVIEINGHNFDEIFEAFEKAKSFVDNPCAIIADTTFGKGISYMEGNPIWHAKAPNKVEFEKAMEELK
jgi:transketolase